MSEIKIKSTSKSSQQTTYYKQQTIPTLYALLLAICLLAFTSTTTATIRYVSHTGSSTPPYTSWETAADSIQKAIDICEPGDTVLVANGVYYEALYIDKTIHLIGSSMDSTIINGSLVDSSYIVQFYDNNSVFINFYIKGPGNDKVGINLWNSDIHASDCKINNVRIGLIISYSSVMINRFIINIDDPNSWVVNEACPDNNCESNYVENIIHIYRSLNNALSFFFGGSQNVLNNIIISDGSASRGISFESQKRVVFKNNLITGFRNQNVSVSSHSDTVFLVNNNSMNVQIASAFNINQGNKTVLRNNIIQNTNIGVYGFDDVVNTEYNLFNNVNQPISGSATLGIGSIFADPMFVKDTMPRPNGSYNFHLQAYSPAIDAGDPSILDVDGSRSDIGMFGGPLGQKYTYLDLAPKPPRNLTATMDSGLVFLKWNKNTEADLYRYRVYRDTVPNFIYDTTKIVAVVADTFYYDIIPDKYSPKDFYYKLTAIDSAYNQSAASEEVHVNITGIPEAPPVIVEHYRLLQNYPNPFNPSTTIPYRLKEPGYVKVMVYNLLGELVRVLVNQWQDKGYYEVLFQPDEIARKRGEEGFRGIHTWYHSNYVSGIYLYRIEVIGEGSIPRFSDMKKMMLVK